MPVAFDDVARDTLSISGLMVAGGVVILNDAGDGLLQVGAFRAGDESNTGTFRTYDLGGIGPQPVHEVEGIYGRLLLTPSGAWQYRLNAKDLDTLALPRGQVAADIFTYQLHDGTSATDLGQLTVNVMGVNTAPTITSSGGGTKATLLVREGDRFVTTVRAQDAEGDALTYSIVGGSDAGKFRIDPATGRLSFKSAPDFDAPRDVGRDNVYDVVVAVSDGAATDMQKLGVGVGDVGARIVGGNRSDIVTAGPTGRAGDGNDWIRGRGGNDVLSGGAGNDTIDGGSGRDLLKGGAGRDVLRGGSGDDFFVFCDRPSAGSADTIVDFRPGHDKLLLSAFNFRGTGWGELSGAAFYKADGATRARDASDRIVYDSASGKLYYDADGKGGAAAIHFATLDDAPRLTVADFLII